MGAKNSKIFPKSSLFGSKGENTSEVDNAGTSVSSSVNMNDSKPSVSTKSTSGPPLHLIPNVNKSSPTSVSQPTDVSTERNVSLMQGKQFAIGDRVLGNFEDAGEWFPGVISGAEGGLYDIAYDDGDAEENVPASSIKFPQVPPGIVTQTSSNLTKSPPLSAIKAASPPSRTMSRILSVKSSSKLIPDAADDNDDNSSTPKSFGMKSTHSSSFKQIPVGKKSIEPNPAVIPVLTVKHNAEVDDYGEYDGSLDFVPQKSTKKSIIVNKYANDDDDEFEELEQDEDNRKHLLTNGMTFERNDSAVIKNMYREDSKNMLLSSHLHDNSQVIGVSKIDQPSGDSVSNSTVENIDRSVEVDSIEAKSSPRVKDEGTSCREKVRNCKDDCDDTQCQQAMEDYITGIDTEGEHGPKYEQLQAPEREEEVDNIARSFVKHEIENSIKMKQAKDLEKNHISGLGTSEASAEKPNCEQNQSDFKEVWSSADDDLFGMNGMDIQRVDSVESVDDGGGEDICYYDNTHEQVSNNKLKNSKVITCTLKGGSNHSYTMYVTQAQDYYDNSHNDSVSIRVNKFRISMLI